MDSGHSGGFHSSSDADQEEYKSRAAVDSVSAFFALSNPPTQQAPPPARVFDTFSNYWQQQLHQNPLPETDISPRSDPIHQINPMPASSPNFTSPELHFPPPPQNQNQTAPRNPRKRSRASRRAPTTVLTTDTTNFRAMVQEFTGIPSPMFSDSPFSRTRFDPFGTRIASFHGASQHPPYLRRPFPQKIQPPLQQPSLASSSSSSSSSSLLVPSIDAAMPMAASSANNNPSITIPQINHQLPIPNDSDILNLNPNPIFTSILQTNPKLSNTSTSSLLVESKSHNNSFAMFPSNDDPFRPLGLGSHFLPPDQNQNSMNAVRWSSNSATAEGDKFNSASTNFKATNGKVSNVFYSSGSSRLNLEMGNAPGNDVVGAARGKGMVESTWICSNSSE